MERIKAKGKRIRGETWRKFIQASIGLFLGWIIAGVIFWAAGWGMAHGAEYRFKTLSVPEARHTNAIGINDLGDVVGVSADCDTCVATAFIYTDGKYYDLGVNDPGILRLYPLGINRDGLIVGGINFNGFESGFVMDGETTTILDQSWRADAINNRGAVVGDWGPGGIQTAFKWKAGLYTTVATVSGILGSAATGINGKGEVVGYYFYQLPDYSFVTQGFVKKAGQVLPLDILPLGINRDGIIVGLAGVGYDGAVLENGIIQLIKYPGADYTQVRGINNKGHLVGYYQKAGQLFGFIAKPIK